MVLKAKVRLNLDLPILNIQPQLVVIAERIIIPDIEGRMNSGIDIDSKAYRSLDPKTIRQKQKKGLRTNVLLATGQLRKSFKFKKVGKNAVRITPSGTRKSFFGERVISNKELGDILQNQGVRSRRGKRFFNFFGISEKAEGKAIKFMQIYIKGAIKRGGRKVVR